MSGIGYPKGSAQYKAEATIGASREATPEPVNPSLGREAGVFLPPPTVNYAALSYGQLLDSLTAPPTSEQLAYADLRYRHMLAASKESVLAQRIRELQRELDDLTRAQP